MVTGSSQCGQCPPRPSRVQGRWQSGGLVGLAGPPGGLAAAGTAVGLPADAGDPEPADWADRLPGSRCRH